MHLYTALDNRIFDKYGIATEHVVLRGGAVAMAALASDEIQSCTAMPISTLSGSRPARTASSWLRFSWDFLLCCWREGTSRRPRTSKVRASGSHAQETLRTGSEAQFLNVSI